MADDPSDPPAKDDDPKQDPNLGDAGKRALDSERKARREAEKQLTEMKTRLEELEGAGKSELQKLTEQLAAANKRADDAEAKVLRFEVATEKGVKPRWLSGANREELEAAADEYLADHPPATGTPPPTGQPAKPVEELKGGSDPTTEPVDVKALIDSIPPTA